MITNFKVGDFCMYRTHGVAKIIDIGIENKDIDYLNQIKKKLVQYERNGEFSTEEGRTLLKTFQT